MSAILRINRDFPFQVALSLDDAVVDVLDWLLEGNPWNGTCLLTCRAIRSGTASAA